jgi:hypothetical protein
LPSCEIPSTLRFPTAGLPRNKPFTSKMSTLRTAFGPRGGRASGDSELPPRGVSFFSSEFVYRLLPTF